MCYLIFTFRNCNHFDIGDDCHHFPPCTCPKLVFHKHLLRACNACTRYRSQNHYYLHQRLLQANLERFSEHNFSHGHITRIVPQWKGIVGLGVKFVFSQYGGIAGAVLGRGFDGEVGSEDIIKSGTASFNSSGGGEGSLSGSGELVESATLKEGAGGNSPVVYASKGLGDFSIIPANQGSVGKHQRRTKEQAAGEEWVVVPKPTGEN